jgi:hypothetical protein
VYVDSCFAPRAFESVYTADPKSWLPGIDPALRPNDDKHYYHRGTWFDGERDFMRLFNFETTHQMTVTLWGRPFEGDTTLTYLQAEFFDGWPNYTREVCEWNEPQTYLGGIDFWLAPCGTLALDFGNSSNRATGSSAVPFEEWSHFAFAVSATAIETRVSLYLNSNRIANAAFTDVLYEGAEHDSYIGSYTDWVYSFHGFLYNWSYWQYVRWSLVD